MEVLKLFITITLLINIILLIMNRIRYLQHLRFSKALSTFGTPEIFGSRTGCAFLTIAGSNSIVAGTVGGVIGRRVFRLPFVSLHMRGEGGGSIVTSVASGALKWLLRVMSFQMDLEMVAKQNNLLLLKDRDNR